MSRGLLQLTILLYLCARTSLAVETGCDYYQNIVAGMTYYVYNPGYPSPYSGQRSCRWFAKSPTRVRLTCEIFSLPPTPNCVGDKLSVSPSGDIQLTDAHNYCGTGSFTIESDGNYMNIVLNTVAGTGGGRFLCNLQATAGEDDSCSCGWKKQTRIVGGIETGVNEYPMMAGLVDAYQKQLYCGGTIISETHVLTAAHCVTDRESSRLAVLIGDHDISTGADTNSSKLLRVARYDVHPMYDGDKQINDIAVVTVLDTIQFSMEVGPACLPFKYYSYSFAGTQVDVLGWGTTEFGGPTSNTLQKVTLDVITVRSCQRSFSSVTDKQICTYANGKDSCQFDSGGPVLWQDPNTRRLVGVGIISYGSACASESPGVNTRIGSYMDWILAVTPGAFYCRVE